MRIIAITGGIGTGKSVVSQLLRVMGYPVYDCDARAKWLMANDSALRQQLLGLFGADTYRADGTLNRPHLASCIFGQPEQLAAMNACVHPAVARDVMAQARLAEASGVTRFFFESAILFSSGFDRLMPPDEVWCIAAPQELRIERAMQRDKASRPQIEARIKSQMSQEEVIGRSTHVIENTPTCSVIAQVRALLTE